MRLLLTILIIFLGACTTLPNDTRTQTEKDAAHKAVMISMVKCGYENAQNVDDGISDAQSIALGLSSVCINEYTNVTQSLCDNKLDNNAQCRMMKDRRNNQSSRINDFLPIVLNTRKDRRPR